VELPAEIQMALADVGAVAREGLLAMSVAAGMAVMQAMFDVEIARGVWAEGPRRGMAGRPVRWCRAADVLR
jgi:putative transposase